MVGHGAGKPGVLLGRWALVALVKAVADATAIAATITVAALGLVLASRPGEPGVLLDGRWPLVVAAPVEAVAAAIAAMEAVAALCLVLPGGPDQRRAAVPRPSVVAAPLKLVAALRLVLPGDPGGLTTAPDAVRCLQEKVNLGAPMLLPFLPSITTAAEGCTLTCVFRPKVTYCSLTGTPTTAGR